MKTLTLLLVLPLLASSGCSSIKHATDRLSDEELAQYLQTGAMEATKFGINYAIKKNPDKVDLIKKDGQIAIDVLRNVVIKNFAGASTTEVVRSAVDQAVHLLSGKLDNGQIAGMTLIAATVLTQVPLPKNPTEALSLRTRLAVEAFFTGMAEGLEAALGLRVPPAPPKD